MLICALSHLSKVVHVNWDSNPSFDMWFSGQSNSHSQLSNEKWNDSKTQIPSLCELRNIYTIAS